MNDSDKRKLLSALSHGSIFFSSTIVPVIIPIIVMLLSNDPVVQANSKEAINFYINLFVYGVIAFILSFVLIGLPLLFVLIGISWIMPIIAVVSVVTDEHKPYRYPFIWHVL